LGSKFIIGAGPISGAIPMEKPMTNEEFKVLAEKYFDQYKKRQEQYFKHIKSRKDLDLIILKGHLLIEDRMNQVFKKTLGERIFQKALNFNFANKIVLLHVLSKADQSFDPFFNAIERLNALRNDLGHHLEVLQFENRIRAVCDIMYRGRFLDIKFRKKTLMFQIKLALNLMSEIIANLSRSS
jgi:hypothetical protein